MRRLENIQYSREHTTRRLMDIYIPEADRNGAAILLIHGGGFSGGKKSQWRSVAGYFCDRGFVCASADYRLAPKWKFPAWVEDVRLAMALFRSHAAEYGFAADRIASMGSSAGAYLALMLATIDPDDDLARTEELILLDTRPNAVVAYCPATSMHEARRGWPREPYPKLMPVPEAQAPDLYRAASVEDRITGAEPPILLIHGTGDETIPHTDSVGLARRIQAAGGHAEVQLLEGVGHGYGYGVETDPQKLSLAFAEEFLAKCL